MRYLMVAAMLLAAVVSPAADHEIRQKDKAFDKATIQVKPGDTIHFVNDDEVTHNVYSRSEANAFTIRKQAPGESSPVAFKEKGETLVRCTIHPKMKLTVKVE